MSEISLLVLSMVPKSLLEVEKAISESYEELNSSEMYSEMKFDNMEQQCSDIIKEQKKKIKNISTEKEHIKQQMQSLQREQMELEEKIRRNKALCEEKVMSETDEDELSELRKKVCTLKEELESKKRNIHHDISQFKKGIRYYNKYLQCNVLVEERNVVVFTPDVSAKHVSDAKEYMKFITPDGNTFQFVEMQPKLENELRLVKRFQETEDIQDFILSFLKALKLFKGSKVK